MKWKTGAIYHTCLIKPKHGQHPNISLFAKVHVLLIENFYAAPNKSKIYIYISIYIYIYIYESIYY